MGLLFFKKPLQAAIREGRKRTTIRRWGRPPVRAGVRSFAPGVGWLAIESVHPVEFADLTDADASADGFETVAGLSHLLHELYPDHATDGKQWFLVRFHLDTPTPASRRNGKPHNGASLFDTA